MFTKFGKDAISFLEIKAINKLCFDPKMKSLEGPIIMFLNEMQTLVLIADMSSCNEFLENVKLW